MQHSFYRFNQLTDLIGVSKTTIYRWIDSGKFPNYIKIGDRAIGWRVDDVHEWIESRASDQEVNHDA